MRYDKRCLIVIVTEIETPLGLEETKVDLSIACAEQNISLEEQKTIYGDSEKEALKLHFPSRFSHVVDEVVYEGKKYRIDKRRNFRRKTVLYISRSGHSGKRIN